MAPTEEAQRAAAPFRVRVALVPSQGETPELDYAMDEAISPAAAIGARVIVPLGRRRATGVVVALPEEPVTEDLRQVLAVIDASPVLDRPLLDLCRWIADYYLAPLGDVLEAALPAGLRFKLERIVSRCSGDATAVPAAEREILAAVDARGGSASLAALRQDLAGRDPTRALRRLQDAGLLRIEETLARETGPTKRESQVTLTRALSDVEEETFKKRRRALYALYLHLHARGGGPLPVAALRASFPDVAAKLRTLGELGLARVEAVEVYREAVATTASDVPHLLTSEQGAAVEAVDARLASGGFETFLLFGVTGSGKTEVYLRAIETTFAAGRGALVLVPEISLTHQLVARVRARFGPRVALLHSGLSPGERWDEWRRLARGEARVAVGARSAMFAPVRDLGLIVVDEEHDGAYKQDDGVRYNARDIAVVRAQRSGCPLVLGSATPSMESFENARRGRYRLLELRQRVEGRPLPEVEVVDLRRRGTRTDQGVPLAPEMIASLSATHSAGDQSLVFINRRGFANFLQCGLCGGTLMCPHCSVSLTLHLRWRALRCHHCDHTLRQPLVCPGCGEPGLHPWGAGTEQVEGVLHGIVPGARIGRMDRDTTARRGAQRELLRQWAAGELDILVGTQMVTKGHDIPGVTFVGVLLADQSLNFPDFRAAERTFQLLTQVAGRAGRGERRGRVVVQTFQPRHYSLRCAATHDFLSFAEEELGHRRELGYPPFSRLVLLRFESERSAEAEATAKAAVEVARGVAGVQVLGPAPAPLERIRNRYRWQVLLRSRQGRAVRQAAVVVRDEIRPLARRRGVRAIVDVDPYSML
jgi:primosomal protein N' (replication factor Y)